MKKAVIYGSIFAECQLPRIFESGKLLMKKIVTLLFLLAAFMLNAQAPAKTNGNTGVVKPKPKTVAYPMELRVKIKGITGKCLLANYYGDKQFVQDTAEVDANGWMVFRDTVLKPNGIYMVVTPSKKFMEVVLDKEQKFSMETDSTDFVANMKVTGSKENQYFYEYLGFLNVRQKEMQPFQDGYKRAKELNQKDSMEYFQKKSHAVDSVVKAYKRNYAYTKHPETFMAKVMKAMEEPESIPYDKFPKKEDGSIDSAYNYKNFRAHYWDNFDHTDDGMVRTPVFHNKLKYYLEKLTPQHPDSIMVACDFLIEQARPSKEQFKYTVYYCTYTYEMSNIMGFDAIFVHIVNKYYKTNQAFWVSETQKTKIVNRADQLSYTLLGKSAVNLNLMDTLGRVRPLQDVKAAYTLVIFWDPTCGHCIKEIPVLKAYYDSLHKAGISFEVYAVYSEQDYAGWKAYIKKNNLTWLNVRAKDAQELATAKYYYDVRSTPTMVLLDGQKKVFAKRLDAHKAGEFLNKRIEQDKEKAQKPN